ncbi:MAG: hypothetical protein Q7U98_17055 [Methylicorpusculum sp.]|uniref:hypothetical protein n=1 Tax=Methylicorpusculum sp. TaxID=2713644 RepID=UPI00271C1FD0|nr:hypothetical protein [Methylicorpusculum sp.]MDO8940865.1 hypothetical protein [Methylicorpusculum sp.]MDP2202443.1 hypothetical protein [Methylicorpusculum sp.]
MHRYNELLKTCLPLVNSELTRERINADQAAQRLRKQQQNDRKTAKLLEKKGVL